MKTHQPEEIGMSSVRLTRINKVMQKYLDQKKLAGMITVVSRRGKVIHYECMGMRDVEENKPMKFDTIFRIYSMTKPIVAVAVMILYEQGYFQLFDPLSKYIPEFKHMKVFAGLSDSGIKLVDQQHDVTIRDLLTHTSGLIYPYATTVGRMYKEKSQEWDALTLGEWIPRLVELPLACQPGTTWCYGYSFDLLGYLIEVLSGMTLDTFLEQEIFKPLGMVDTAFFVPGEKIDRFAAMYTVDDNGKLETMESPVESIFAKPRAFLSGGAGLVSTIGDFLRFCQMLLNKGVFEGTRLLSRKSVELMTHNHLPSSLLPLKYGSVEIAGYGFGFGVGVLMDVFKSSQLGSEGSYGWEGAANTHFWIDPKEELIGLIMTQFQPFSYYPVWDEFRVLTYQAIID